VPGTRSSGSSSELLELEEGECEEGSRMNRSKGDSCPSYSFSWCRMSKLFPPLEKAWWHGSKIASLEPDRICGVSVT
jgi:hypothetical protein